MADKDKIVISRILDAPREFVWKCWTEPEEIARWWGPEGFTAPNVKVDLRVGGKYVFCMHGPKGTQFDKDMYSAGDYIEIFPMRKIVASDYFSDEFGNFMEPREAGMDINMPKKMDVVVTFEDAEEGKTLLTIEYPEPETKEQFEAMKKSGLVDGWNSSLDKLASVVKKPD